MTKGKQGFIAATDDEKKRKGTFQPIRSEDERGVLKLERYELCDPPHDFDKNEVESWQVHRDILNKIGLVSFADLPLVKEMCILHARLTICNAMMKIQGAYYENATNGNPMKHPLVEIYNSTLDRYLSLCGEFGMSPKSRNRIGMQGMTKKQEATETAGGVMTKFLQNKPR